MYLIGKRRIITVVIPLQSLTSGQSSTVSWLPKCPEESHASAACCWASRREVNRGLVLELPPGVAPGRHFRLGQLRLHC